jgi:ADP-heptose:LPS heptosyltransferase
LEWAKKYKRKKGNRRVVLWAVGSSIHKVCPYMDQVIARIMVTYKDVNVILVGDELDRLLDTGWENEPRVIKKAGKWSIRETLAFAEVSDLVIGAETGILNAVSFRSIPKIIMLSHSSIENLTRDWVNCTSITPDDCDCYPCHQLNSTFNECLRHETGVAMCQGNVSVEKIWEAIQGYLGA